MIEPNFIYLAAPYSSGDTSNAPMRLERYEAVTRVAVKLYEAGLIVFSPITHSHLMVEQFGLIRPFEWWLELDVAFLSKAQALYVLMLDGWAESKGVMFEIEYAKLHDIPTIFLAPEQALMEPPVLSEDKPELTTERLSLSGELEAAVDQTSKQRSTM